MSGNISKHIAVAYDLDQALDLYKETGYVLVHGVKDFLSFSQNFGILLRQYDGEVIWTIKPKAEFEGVYHSMNSRELTPHTEGYEFNSRPPRMLALWCVNPGAGEDGRTYLSDTWPFFESHITKDEANILKDVPIRYFTTPGLEQEHIVREAWHPFISYSDDGTILTRYSERCMEIPDVPGYAQIMARFRQFIADTKIEICWRKDACLVWDNHRLVHSRSGFSDRSRELRRLWLGPNLRNRVSHQISLAD